MHLVDSHCHLNYPQLASDIEGVFQRAVEAQVKTFLTISTQVEDIPTLIDYTQRFSSVYATIGVHPHEADKIGEGAYQALERYAVQPKVVGIGETGLDYYYDHSDRKVQRKVFEQHLALAADYNLPVVIHTREADADTIEILESFKGRVKGVFHCFSGTPWLMEKGLELGFYISASGIITFKKAQALGESFAQVPLDRLLVETDSPYLAPEPHRGKSNEPAFVRHVAEKLAAIKGISLEEIAHQTTQNFFRLFHKCVL